jgi:hypothetical protein
MAAQSAEPQPGVDREAQSHTIAWSDLESECLIGLRFDYQRRMRALTNYLPIANEELYPRRMD